MHVDFNPVFNENEVNKSSITEFRYLVDLRNPLAEDGAKAALLGRYRGLPTRLCYLQTIL